MNTKTVKRSFWICGVIFLVVGGVGWWDRMLNGHQNADYGSIVPWGLWIAVYILFIGLSAGAFLISSLVYAFGVKKFESIGRVALVTALITLAVALLSVWADIGHMSRFWEVYAYPNFSSPMAWMIWLYTAYFILLVVETWLVLRRDMVVASAGTNWKARVYRVLTFFTHDTSDESETRDRKVVKILAAIGIPVAIMFHGGVGTLFAVVAARPAWNTGLFPLLFLLSALVSGGAMLTFVAAIFQGGLKRNRQVIIDLGKLVLGLLLLEVLFQIAEILVVSYGAIPGHVAPLQMMISGPHWWVFWFGQLLVGAAIPIVILASKKRLDARWVAGAAALIVVGFVGVRLNIVIPSLSVDMIKGLEESVASPRISTEYFPTAMEWLVTLGIVGLGMLLFGLAEDLLIDEPEEGSASAPPGGPGSTDSEQIASEKGDENVHA